LSSTPSNQDQSAALTPDGARQFRAPARVNIIGEHTDYNDGLVLPTTTALFTSVTATPRADRIVKVTSRQMQDTQGFDLDDVELVEDPQWIDYAKGVAAEIEMEGVRLLGADLHMALLEISAASLSGPAIAKLCQRAENRYAGVSCGIMDQYVIACCEANMAMLLDCRTLHTEQVAIPADLRLLITDSGFKHNLPVSGYNNRLGECALACRILAQDAPEVTALRDLSMDSLESRRGQLDDLLYRRCRHVVSEIQRVRDAFAALQTGDLDRLGNLISASHTSLRDDYDVSRDEVDQLVEIADGSSGVLGSRMVGAGFGGCVLSLVEADKIDEAAREVRQKYGELTGDEPWMHIVQAAPPAREVGHLGANEQS
jgi:galactokinase